MKEKFNSRLLKANLFLKSVVIGSLIFLTASFSTLCLFVPAISIPVKIIDGILAALSVTCLSKISTNFKKTYKKYKITKNNKEKKFCAKPKEQPNIKKEKEKQNVISKTQFIMGNNQIQDNISKEEVKSNTKTLKKVLKEPNKR